MRFPPMKVGAWIVVAVVLLLSIGSVVLLSRSRTVDGAAPAQSLDREFYLQLPKGARVLHAARLDGTPRAVIQCTKQQVDELLSNPLFQGKEPETLVHYMHNQPQLPWWRPQQIPKFRFWDIRLPSGDALHVLIEGSDTDPVRVFLIAFET